MMKCHWEETVSDADFGYWNSAWGEPGVQTFTCDEPAVVVFTFAHEHGADLVGLCTLHLAAEVQ